MSHDILITDLPARVVGGFTGARGVGEGWVPVSWETAELRGTGLSAGSCSGALALSLELGLRGPHILHLALGSHTGLRVWFDGEPGYREFITHHGGMAFQECPLHGADLTGRRLHIALKDDQRPSPAWLGYLRAEPWDGPRVQARNLIATNDGFSWVAGNGLQSVRDVSRFFTPFRDSDFGLMLWCPTGADFTGCHRTRVGTCARTDTLHAFRECDRRHAGQFAALLASGGDLLAAAVENARSVGMAIHFYIRMEAFKGPFPWEHAFTSRFYEERPEWRCRDEHGDEIARMSYAFAGVQEHMLAYFEELLDYQPDGLCLAFNRGLPMMIAEEPVLAEFELRQGRRPRLPDEIDSDGMIAARTTLMTGFFERVKALLDRRGRELSCIVKPDETFNRTCGLDIEALAERGIFSTICVHNGGFNAEQSGVHQSLFWRRLRDSGRARIYPNGWGGSYDHAETARFLRDNVFGQGFAGGFFWDVDNLSENPYNWHVIGRGGTPTFLEDVVSGKIPSPTINPLTRVQGVKLGRYNPKSSY